MTSHDNASRSLDSFPLDASHWQAIYSAMGLSQQHARVLELVLCDYSNQQIAETMNLSRETVKTYLKRITDRIGVRGRMQLAMHVLAVSHQIPNNSRCLTTE